MLQRLSKVDFLNVLVASFSSVIQVGDSRKLQAFSRALAVQREAEIFYGNEGNFPSFNISSRPIMFQPITEDISFTAHNSIPIIKVKNIEIIGMSNASVIHVGNSNNVSMESRVKHIRMELPYGHEQDIS